MLKIFAKKFLYFPGCLINSVMPEIAENYQEIFAQYKIPYFRLEESNCCGAVAHTNGYNADFEELRSRNYSLFNENKVKMIATNSGDCMHAFALQYGINVKHVSQILEGYADKFPVKYEEEVSLYDSPNLPVFDAPRKILDSLGFEIVELEKNRENAILCGAEGGMMQNVPQLAANISKEVFKLCTTKKLIVADPLAYYHLKQNAPRNITVLELSEVII